MQTPVRGWTEWAWDNRTFELIGASGQGVVLGNRLNNQMIAIKTIDSKLKGEWLREVQTGELLSQKRFPQGRGHWIQLLGVAISERNGEMPTVNTAKLGTKAQDRIRKLNQANLPMYWLIYANAGIPKWLQSSSDKVQTLTSVANNTSRYLREIAWQFMWALGTAQHRWGLVHGDLKGDNVVVRARDPNESNLYYCRRGTQLDEFEIDRSAPVLVLVDIGSSYFASSEREPRRTSTDSGILESNAIATPVFSTNRKLEKNPIAAANDLFSVGVILLALGLTGTGNYDASKSYLAPPPFEDGFQNKPAAAFLSGTLDMLVRAGVKVDPTWLAEKWIFNDMKADFVAPVKSKMGPHGLRFVQQLLTLNAAERMDGPGPKGSAAGGLAYVYSRWMAPLLKRQTSDVYATDDINALAPAVYANEQKKQVTDEVVLIYNSVKAKFVFNQNENVIRIARTALLKRLIDNLREEPTRVATWNEIAEIFKFINRDNKLKEEITKKIPVDRYLDNGGLDEQAIFYDENNVPQYLYQPEPYLGIVFLFALLELLEERDVPDKWWQVLAEKNVEQAKVIINEWK